MLIAGEASGDTLGAELITALRAQLTAAVPTTDAPPQFFGAGGPLMAAAGMELIFDFTQRAVFGLEALKRLGEFRQRLLHLKQLAVERRPDVIVCVDFAGFNRRFAHAVKEHVRNAGGGWNPKIVQYVSPQVWASRPSRADKMAKDIDLLLAIFPFEKDWYARRTPQLRVEFVGHPMIDRYAGQVPERGSQWPGDRPCLVLLPGSRPGELKRHLAVMLETLRLIRKKKPGAQAVMVLSDRMATLARTMGLPSDVEVQSNLAAALAQADLALAKSGTVTMECAHFRVPTVVMYKVSLLLLVVARMIMTVKWITMTNILANEEVFPEFQQGRATPENLARAALELLTDPARRTTVQMKLEKVATSLGEPGASRRAAEQIIRLLAM